MLSKVLSRKDAANVQAMVFPLMPGLADNHLRTEESTPGRGDEDVASLRDNLHRLQLSVVAERREATEAGRRQGDQEARAELLPVMERLNASIAEIVGMRGDLRRRAERDVVQLALMIARRVLHRQLSVDDGALTAIAHVAFERLTRSESYTVTVHPRFAASVASALPSAQASRIQIKPDPECEPGTLTIRSTDGVIDASVDAQLDEISRGLADRLGNNQ